jgi:GntR family transcriptional regulator
MKKRAPPRFVAAPESGTPLYVQLSLHLAEAIRAGHYQAHQALPSERVLSESLGLSRVTTRKAIDQLAAQGLIVRRAGSGNYIAPRIENPLSRLTSFSEQLQARGYTPSSRWLSRVLGSASREEREVLRLRAGARVARLERLRIADDEVVSMESCVLPASVLPEPERLEGSLYEFLDAAGKAPVRAVQHIRALNASAHLAHLLHVPVGRALLFVKRIGYLASGRPIELTLSYCRDEYFDLVAELSRNPGISK